MFDSQVFTTQKETPNSEGHHPAINSELGGDSNTAEGSSKPAAAEGGATTNSGKLQKYDSRKQENGHYKKFDFFYRRTAFRSMTEFYKGLFRPILEKWREGERKSTKNFVLSYFVKLSEIGETLVNLSGKATVKDLRLIEQLSRDQGKTAKNPGPQANKSRTKDPVEDKTIAGIRPTFEPFTSGRTDVEMPLSEKDKHIIKDNMRKLALFDCAYRFCDEIFDFDFQCLLNEDGEDDENAKEEGWLDSPMNADQLCEVSAAFLSIVLSHHYQKPEIKKIVDKTDVDFGIVRDTMHKYSKRAEEKFFKRSCWAFFFIQFAWSRHGKAYIDSKLTANAEKAAQACKD